MEEFKEKISKFLKEKGIGKDYSSEIEKLYKDKLMNESMPYNASLAFFLMHMSQTCKMFENMLKKKYLFDLICRLDASKLSKSYDADQIHSLLMKKYKTRAEYVHIESENSEFKIFVKFTSEIYLPLKNEDVPDYLIPYKLLIFSDELKITDFIFEDVLFTPESPKNIHKIYAEFMEHLKSLNIPLPITSDDLLFENTSVLPFYHVNIYLPESSQWPKDQDAIECAKAAFYCQLYLKSQYRAVINKEYCVFKYKGVHFIVKILLKSDFSVKHKILTKVHEIIKTKGEIFFRKVILIKTILGNLGLYPLIFDDFLVDSLVLMVDKTFIGDAKFLKEFINFDFNLENRVLDLENQKLYSHSSSNATKSLKIAYKDLTFNMILPSSEHFTMLKEKLSKLTVLKCGLISEEFSLQTDSMLSVASKEFDFILSKDHFVGMNEIIGNFSNQFDLGTPIMKEFTGNSLSKAANFLYNPFSHTLMVKAHADFDIDLLKNLIINETSFEYISG